jgi:hypothetical protein
MGVVADLVKDVPLPKMFRVKQIFDAGKIDDVEAAVIEQLSRPEIKNTIRRGMSVCLTCTSRGVDNLALVLKLTAGFCRWQGASPFIVPAMGSHGGATAEGQLAIASGYGVTEEYCGCRIISCMDTVEIGKTPDGIDVYIDAHAAKADGIIVINRIKPHTDFTGPYESGIMKMMAIGLGKQYGASKCHTAGFGAMAKMVPAFGQVVLDKTNILFGLGLVENAYDKTWKVRALTPGEIPELEPRLLDEARDRMPRIMFDTADVLVVDEIGKNISGDGMDPNITGRFTAPYKTGGITAQRVVVLDVTEESQGNILGAGIADFGTMRIFNKFDFEKTYPNCITSRVPIGGFLPLIMQSDRLAIQGAVRTCVGIDEANLRLIRIKNTLSMGEIELSQAYYGEAEKNPSLAIVGGLYDLPFDGGGNLR